MAAPAMPRILVLGGGLTGLSAAYELAPAAAAGRVQVTLLESADRPGGKVETARPEGLVIEQGPDSFLATPGKPWARDLCRDLGLEGELVATPPVGRRSFVYHAGRLHPLPAGVVTGMPSRLGPFLATRLLTPAGKARALLDLVLPRVLPPDGSDVALGRLLRARLGPEVVDRLVEPLLSGIYAADADRLSLDATFPNLRRQEAQHRSLILGAMAEARRARCARAAAGATAPPPPPFLTLRQGLATLVDALAARLRATPGVELRTGAEVHALERSARGGYTVRLAGEEVHADAVVIALPAPQAARVLADAAPDAARELGGVAYADVALVAFAFDRAAVAHRMAGSGFVVPRRADIAVTACTWVSAKWPESAPPDTALLRVYLGRAGEHVLERDDHDLVTTARAALRRSMRIEAEPRLVRVMRVPQGLPQYAVGHLARVERIEAALSHLPAVWATGSAFRGVGMPDCVRQGREAAEAALAWASSAAPR